jgi:hypothetical protein
MLVLFTAATGTGGIATDFFLAFADGLFFGRRTVTSAGKNQGLLTRPLKLIDILGFGQLNAI